MKNAVVTKNDVAIISVFRKGVEFKVWIDTQDLALVSDFPGTWHLNNRGYISRTISNKRESLHRLLVTPPKGQVVDHIDGNPLNNCRNNLRVIKPSHNQQNIRNPHKLAGSGLKGVRRESRWGDEPRWNARIAVWGKEKSLGTYDDIEDANVAAIIGRILYHPYSKEHAIYNDLLEKKIINEIKDKELS